MQHHDSLLEQLKSASQPQEASTRIFLKVEDIQSSPHGPTVAIGIDLLKNERIHVRLNTIEERVADLSKNKRATIDKIQQQVKNQYAGAYARESLEIKRDKRHAAYLCFDHCVPTSHSNDGPATFRSHWAELMSADKQAEIIHGLATIQTRQAGTHKSGIKKDTAWIEFIEQVSTLVPQQTDLNLSLISKALNNHDDDGMPRSGYGMLQLLKDNSIYSEVKLFQNKKKVAYRDHYNQLIEFLTEVSAQESLNHLINHENNHKSKEVAILNDIAKVTLGALAGFKLHQQLFSNSDPHYLQTLRDLYADLKSGLIKVNLIGVRTILFGPDSTRNVIKKIQGSGPLSIYQKKYPISPDAPDSTVSVKVVYLPSTAAIHRHIDSNRPYAVFCLPTSSTATRTAYLLSDVSQKQLEWTHLRSLTDEDRK